MVPRLSFTGVDYCKVHVDGVAFVGDVSVRNGFDGVEPHSDIEITNAVPKHSSPEAGTNSWTASYSPRHFLSNTCLKPSGSI